MTTNEQYAMDVWRLGSHGQAPPPAPGSHEAKLLRAWWVARREARKEFGRARAGAPTGPAWERGRKGTAAPAAGAVQVARRPLRRRARRA